MSQGNKHIMKILLYEFYSTVHVGEVFCFFLEWKNKCYIIVALKCILLEVPF